MVAAIVVSIAIWMAGTMQEFSVAAWQDMAGSEPQTVCPTWNV